MNSYSLTNILKNVRQIQSLMSLDELRRTIRSESNYDYCLNSIRQLIEENLVAIRSQMNSRAISAADLKIRSRRAFQWMDFLLLDDNLIRHLDALQRLNLYLPGVHPRHWKRIQITFYHQAALYQVRKKNQSWELKIQESFISAPDAVLTALLGTVKPKPDPELRRIIKDHTFTKTYQENRKTLEYLDIPPDSFAAGLTHHLGKSFCRVNQIYFGGKISRPHLTWNNRLTHRKFGHYQWDTDTVMVSKTLDQPDVPELVVDYVMYHELLHKELGVKQADTNRISHTREFRLREEKFQNITRAKEELNKLARKQARS